MSECRMVPCAISWHQHIDIKKRKHVCVSVLEIGFGCLRYATTEQERGGGAEALGVIVHPAAGTSTVSEQR